MTRDGARKRVGMTYFKQIAALLLVTFGAGSVAWAQATAALSPPPAAAPILSQTIGGLTVEVTRVRWSVAKSPKSSFYPPALFTVHYTVLADPTVLLPAGTRLLDCVQSVTAENPSGFQYEDTAGFHFPYGQYGGHNGGSMTWDNVDPRDAAVRLSFELRNPSASPREAGDSEAPITVTNIPVPLPDADMPVHAETITPLGTHFIVENVKVTTKPDADGNRTFLTLHIVPAAGAADLEFEHSTGTRIVDDTGARISGDGTSTGGSRGPAVEILGIRGVPSPGAKTLTLTLDGRESSESLRQHKFFPQFHLFISLQSVVPVRRRTHPPLATFQDENVTATLDSLGIKNGCYQTRIILRDRHDPAVIWRVYAIHGETDTGTLLQNTHGAYSVFWKANNAPIAEGDNGWEVLVSESGTEGRPGETPPPAKTLSLAVDLRAYRQDSVSLDFNHVPVPAPGQTLALKRRVRDASGAYLVLRKVAMYSPSHPLPPGFDYPGRRSGLYPAPSGLAVVMAEPPAVTGKNEFDFDLVSASDSSGDALITKRTLNAAPGDALLGAAQDASDGARVKTFYLAAPLPGVQAFNLHFYHDHSTRLDVPETVPFTNVPAPHVLMKH